MKILCNNLLLTCLGIVVTTQFFRHSADTHKAHHTHGHQKGMPRKEAPFSRRLNGYHVPNNSTEKVQDTDQGPILRLGRLAGLIWCVSKSKQQQERCEKKSALEGSDDRTGLRLLCIFQEILWQP